MKFLPFENITYRTRLSAPEALNRIKHNLEPVRRFRRPAILGDYDHKIFEGEVAGLTFRMVRIIGYRNAFLPQITGRIEPDYDGTRIHVKMRLPTLAFVFMLLWCSFVGFGLVMVVAKAIREEAFEPAGVIPLGMLLVGYGLTTGGFKYESRKAKKLLAQVLEAE